MAAKRASKKAARKASSRRKVSRETKTSPARTRAGAAVPRMISAAPSFTVNDLQKSLTWYRDVVGFVVEERWEEAGELKGVQLRAGDVRFMIGQDDWKKGRGRKKGEGFRLYCRTTQDVDALAKGIVARGGRLDHEPRDQPWGAREFALTDPDGFKISIAKETR
jgi:uncharacterized glyoxalase superfamily protein PhnB